MKHGLVWLALCLPLAVLAGTPPNQQGQNREAFRQRIFEQRKSAEMASHQERIRILQTADACIRNATTPDTFKACEETERNERKAFIDKERARRESIKQQISQFQQRR